MSEHASVTSPPEIKGKQAPVEVLHLDEIPGAMDKMGWKTAAKIMRHWFSIAPAYIMPPNVRRGDVPPSSLAASQYDDQIIKMDWALGFDRTTDAFDDLVRHWNSPAGIKLLKQRLAKAGWTPGSSTMLGSRNMRVRELDEICQVNVRSFGDTMDTLDDMYGALGKASYKLAVVGQTERTYSRDVFKVEKIGVYVRDTYDFNDDEGASYSEPLGVWSKDRILTKAETIEWAASPQSVKAKVFPGFVYVSNSHFRLWQKAHNSGGDFVVYSDVKWLDSPTSTIDLS